MKALLATCRRKLATFRAAQEGVAAVEFALILPFLLVLYVGSVEVSEMITADRRVNTVSGMVGDLVARSDGSITQDELDSYFAAADVILQPYPTAELKQVVTCVFIDADGATSVIWSEGYNGGVAHPEHQPYQRLAVGASDMNVIARGNYVIVSETSYAYTPVFGFRMNETLGFHQDLTTINIYHENFHVPRFGELITLSP